MTEPMVVKVVEAPAEKLRRVAGLEGAPREELWEAIASAVININERMAVLEADADARRCVVEAIKKRVGLPPLVPQLNVVHVIADGEAVTSCCGRTPFELPRTDRITTDPRLGIGCGKDET